VGHAHVLSRQGEFEGAMTALMEPPARLRVEMRSKALFGMVGERLVVAMPGDGHVLLFRDRQDTLERQTLQESDLGRLLPTGEPGELQALIAGRPPWPGGRVPEDLQGVTRVLQSRDAGRTLQVVVEVPGTDCTFELETRDGRLRRFAWAKPGRERLEVRYERWRTWDGLERPTRLRLEIPGEGLRAEIDLERAEARRGLTERDFEVY
jgi:hypothetical protein